MKHMRCTFWSMNKTRLKFVFAKRRVVTSSLLRLLNRRRPTVVKRPETADLEMRALL